MEIFFDNNSLIKFIVNYMNHKKIKWNDLKKHILRTNLRSVREGSKPHWKKGLNGEKKGRKWTVNEWTPIGKRRKKIKANVSWSYNG